MGHRVRAKDAIRKAHGLARRRPPGFVVHAVRQLLRRPPPRRRSSRSPTSRHRRAVRQRGRDHPALRGRRRSTRPSTGSGAAGAGLAFLTCGARGSVVVARRRGRTRSPADPVERVVDTTGAGDLYAAGALYGLATGRRPRDLRPARARLAAAEVISHLGAPARRSPPRPRRRRRAAVGTARASDRPARVRALWTDSITTVIMSGDVAVERRSTYPRAARRAAAAEVFAERGYDGAGVQEIARRAGLTTGAIYSRFSGKAELLRDAIDAAHHRRARRAVRRAPLRGPRRATSSASPAPTSSTRPDEDAAPGQRPAARGVRRRPPRPRDPRRSSGASSSERAGRLAEIIEAAKADGSHRPDARHRRRSSRFCHAVGLGFLLFEAIDIDLPLPEPVGGRSSPASSRPLAATPDTIDHQGGLDQP